MAPSDNSHGLHRSVSTTSLSKHYQTHASDAHEISNTDFCNGFWGLNDEGYDVLLARLRGASRTVDEVRGFWKERAAIEEEYARKLVKLSKQPVGKDEIGSLRVALDTLRTETLAQGQAHQELTDAMRSDVEGPAATFAQKLANMKKNSQSTLERAYKLKKSQEGYVSKARDKYNQECLRINSYTAQTSLSQGRELDRVSSKLEKAQGSVGANERDFGNFVKTLGQTTRQWETEWKNFCDHIQDLEEERVDFIKDIAWSYANAVSSVCVTDDEACERLRVVLEALEPHVESESFVRGYGTGSKIPDPPPFVSYAAGESDPTEPTYRLANFARKSDRAAPPPSQAPAQPTGQAAAPPPATSAPAVIPIQAPIPAPAPAPVAREPELPSPPATPQYPVQAAPAPAPAQPIQQQHRSSYQQPPPTDYQNQAGSSSSTNGYPAPAQPQYPSMAPPAPPSQQQPYRAPSTDSYAQRGQTMSPSIQPAANGASNGAPAQEEDDPLAKALADLQLKRMSRGGSFRSARSGQGAASPATSGMDGRFGTQPPIQEQPRSRRGSVLSTNSDVYSPPGPSNGPPPSSFQPGHRQTPSLVPPMAGSTSAALAQSQADFDRRSSRRSMDYSQAGESIVGAHPNSRPNSPAQARSPSPAFMSPPSQPPSTMPVEAVLSRYQQSFPGESSSHSRKNSTSSRMSRTSIAAPPTQQTEAARSPSPARAGFVGIGAGGRSPSPQPFSPPGRSHSPAPDGQWQHQQPPTRQPSPAPYQQQQIPPRQASPAPHQQQQHQIARQPSPAPSSLIPPRQPSPAPSGRHSIGLALGADGTVAHDEMAEAYRRQQHQQQQQQQQQYQPQQPHQQYQQPHQQATSSRPPHPQQHQPPAHQAPVAAAPPPQHAYGGYTAPPPQQQQPYGYGAPPPQHQQQPSYQGGYPQQQPQQQYPAYGATPPPQQQQQAGYPARQSSYGGAPDPYAQQHQIQRSASPAPRAPSPAPPQQAPAPAEVEQFTEEGAAVIFYVKALYDYTATIDEEFDFQAGDIIAVTTCSDDGWWNGALLDESRRIKGKNVFPSNFVTMF